LFVTFEGIEGCGKTTQVKRVAGRLEGLGLRVLATFEPGGTPIGQDIRRILLDAQNRDLYPLAELLLYEADRAQHMARVVIPALNRGTWVLCDRFFDATTVYQGYARGLDLSLIELLNNRVSSGIQPDITFLHDCPVEVGLTRARGRDVNRGEDGQDRFERERRAFHQAVREGYLELARRYSERFVVIDATRSEEDVEGEVFDRLKSHLPRNVR
jgi:dTMP kinase